MKNLYLRHTLVICSYMIPFWNLEPNVHFRCFAVDGEIRIFRALLVQFFFLKNFESKSMVVKISLKISCLQKQWQNKIPWQIIAIGHSLPEHA